MASNAQPFEPAAGAERAHTMRLFLVILATVTILRIVVLALSPLELSGDEAQYWFWSRHLAWGYFSKPPLIGWTINVTTGVFGDAEWAVRLTAPLAHAAAAAALHAMGRRMYGPRAGLWAGVGWLLLPGAQLSAAIVTTDALVLPLWSIALFATWRLTETRSWRTAILLGAALGFGILAKYAMLYFLIGLASAIVLLPKVRAALLSLQGALALAIAVALFTPNVIWNAQHDFATLAHTAANADLGRKPFRAAQLLTFLRDQTGVAGLFFPVLLWMFFRMARAPRAADERDVFLLGFILPTLLIIAVQSTLSRAHANWAAAAYPASVIWLAGQLETNWGRRFRVGANALHALLGIALMIALLSPQAANAMHLGNSLKRLRGWAETAEIVSRQVAEAPYSAIVVDDRLTFFDLDYYLREKAHLPPLRIWVLRGHPGNTAELAAPMLPELGGRALVLMALPRYEALVAEDFKSFRLLRRVQIPLGGGKARSLALAEGSGFAPAPRDAAFFARVDGPSGQAR